MIRNSDKPNPFNHPEVYEADKLRAQIASLQSKLDAAQKRAQSEFDIATMYHKKWQSTESRLGAALGALSELVCLKDLKDKSGKTEKYLERQPEAWKDARAVLDAENGRNQGPIDTAVDERVSHTEYIPTRCLWREVDEADCTIWESACGQKWEFTNGGPTDNNVKFCNRCGLPIEIAISYVDDVAEKCEHDWYLLGGCPAYCKDCGTPYASAVERHDP